MACSHGSPPSQFRGIADRHCDNDVVVLIAKIGTSSLTDDEGHLRAAVIQKLCDEVAAVRARGRDVVIVSSGAIGAGLPALGFAASRPKDARTLQAASAVGQSRLMGVYDEARRARV